MLPVVQVAQGERSAKGSPFGSPSSTRKLDANSLKIGIEQEMARNRSGSIAETLGLNRSRANSIVDDVELKRLEFELFKYCCPANQTKANSGVLLRELERMGIRRDDPRLAPVISELHNFKRKAYSAIYGIDNLLLDITAFKKVLSKSTVLISKGFRGQLVIPEFEEFCATISSVYEKCRLHNMGKVADYIPQLARGNPSKWGVSLCTIDGQRFSVGDVKDQFTVQSTSKPLTYALCLNERGADVVQKFIGREPSGRTFNEIALDYNGQPHNPMVNSGAIMSSALLLYMVRPELSVSEKFEFVHKFFKSMSGGSNVGFANSVFLSERESADRNNSIAYFMREQGCFPNGKNDTGGSVDIKNVLDFYFQCCSLEMDTEGMAVIAGTLANGGICPITGERVLDSEAVKNVLSLMYSCGMYNYSGQFAFKVGLPAKSGVSGIILVVVPNVVGFATWSPNLDAIGNSARGVMFYEELVQTYSFHTFDCIGKASSHKKDPTVHTYESLSQKLVGVLFAANNGDKLALERAHLAGIDMNLGDYDGRTALHLAASEGHISCVKFLLETVGVDAECVDRWGHTPLSEAVKFHRPRVIALLKKFMSIKNMAEPTTELNETEEDESNTGRHGHSKTDGADGANAKTDGADGKLDLVKIRVNGIHLNGDDNDNDNDNEDENNGEKESRENNKPTNL